MAKMKEFLHNLKVLEKRELGMPDQLIKKLLIHKRADKLQGIEFVLYNDQLFTKRAFEALTLSMDPKPQAEVICPVSATCFFSSVQTLEDVCKALYSR